MGEDREEGRAHAVKLDALSLQPGRQIGGLGSQSQKLSGTAQFIQCQPARPVQAGRIWVASSLQSVFRRSIN